MAEEWISTHPDYWRSRSAVNYAITTLASQEIIGAIGLVSIEDGQASMGYWISEPCWGKGYCTEAGKRLVQFAFQNLDLTRIYAEHLSVNPASGRVMQNIGMRHCKTTEKSDRNGQPASVELYIIKQENSL